MAALLYRKALRDKIRDVMANSFNAKIAELASVYGLTPFEIDFLGESSTTFAMANVDPSNVEICELLEFPAAALATTNAQDTGDPRGFSFSGPVTARLAFFIRDRGGLSVARAEDDLDMVEDAVLSILNDPAIAWSPSSDVGVIFTRQVSIERQAAIPLGDGVGQFLGISANFKVISK